MDDKTNAQKAGIRRHAWWLAGAAVGVYAIYIVYVYVFTTIN